MTCNQNGIYINTVSGGIVNFGGAVKIAPVSISKSTAGSGTPTSAVNIPGLITNTGALQGAASSA